MRKSKIKNQKDCGALGETKTYLILEQNGLLLYYKNRKQSLKIRAYQINANKTLTFPCNLNTRFYNI